MKSTSKFKLIATGLQAFVLTCRNANCQTIADINKLSAKLLNGYNRNTIPSNTQDVLFTVHVGAVLLTLGGLDEVNGKLTTIFGFSFNWTDDSMVWNITEHSNITNITMDQGSVWLPYLQVENIHYDTETRQYNKDMDKVLYLSNGKALFIPLRVLNTDCNMDMTYYPFDKQTCRITMFLSGYEGYSIRMTVNRDIGFQQFFPGDGTWDIPEYTVEGNDNSYFNITIVFERKALYTLINVFLPILVLAVMSPLVFILPSETGERTGFAVTLLLAISVYMTIVGEHLPQKSDPMPLVCILLFVWYVKTSSMIFIVIVNIKIRELTKDTGIPTLLLYLVKLTRRCTSKKSYVTNPAAVDHIQNDETEVKVGIEENEITWQEVSRTIDIVVLIASYIIELPFTLVFLIILSYNS